MNEKPPFWHIAKKVVLLVEPRGATVAAVPCLLIARRPLLRNSTRLTALR